MIFLNFCPTVHIREVFPAILFLPILLVFYFGILIIFFYFLYTPSWQWRPTLFVLELRHLFLWSSGQSVKKKRNCQIVEDVWTMTKQVVKIKDLRRQTKDGWPFFHKMFEKYCRKSCKYMRNISTKQKVKKFQLHIIDQSFEHNAMGISYQKKLESLEEKKAVHTSCKHGVRRICQLYTKGGPAGKLTWCEPPRDHLDYRRRDNIQRSSPQNTGRAKTVTTLRLEECDFGHALGARTFYTSPLRKCQKTYRKTFWLLIF